MVRISIVVYITCSGNRISEPIIGSLSGESVKLPVGTLRPALGCFAKPQGKSRYYQHPTTLRTNSEKKTLNFQDCHKTLYGLNIPPLEPPRALKHLENNARIKWSFSCCGISEFLVRETKQE